VSDRLQIDGLSIEYRWWKRDDQGAPPIVLLHEGLGSIAMWRDFPDALAAATGRSVFAYSRVGHGASDAPPTPHTIDFMHDEARDSLPRILDHVHIDRAVLLGHSDGGSIALIFAAEHPASTDGLVLESPHVFVEDVSIGSIRRMQTLYESTDLRERLAKYHSNVDAAFHGWNDVWLSPEFRTWNLESYLPRISCPTLVIQGEQDEYGTLKQVEAIERQLAGPVETLIVPDCGHSPHRDRPDAVLKAVVEFCGSPGMGS